LCELDHVRYCISPPWAEQSPFRRWCVSRRITTQDAPLDEIRRSARSERAGWIPEKEHAPNHRGNRLVSYAGGFAPGNAASTRRGLFDADRVTTLHRHDCKDRLASINIHAEYAHHVSVAPHEQLHCQDLPLPGIDCSFFRPKGALPAGLLTLRPDLKVDVTHLPRPQTTLDACSRGDEREVVLAAAPSVVCDGYVPKQG
jgi:hypothetical protein